MATDWTELSAQYLLRTTSCPRCDAPLERGAVCPVCRADLRGEPGRLVFAASETAAAALRDRQRLIDALPVAEAVAPVSVAPVASPTPKTVDASGRAAAQASTVARRPAAQPTTPRPTAAAPTAPAAESPISVQSVLAVAGAGLLAVAAIVFTYLNPDVGFGMRTIVIGVLTLLFGAAAWVLQRREVTFSAEAIGALAMVFLAFDVQALAEIAPPGVSGWWYAALGTLVAAGAMFLVARIARIRTWLWASLVGLALVPAFAGYGAGGTWGAIWGHTLVAAVVIGGQQLARTAERAFASRLRTEHVTLAALQFIATGVVLLQLPFPYAATTFEGAGNRVAVLLVLTALAVLATRYGQPASWSVVAGMTATIAAAVATTALPIDGEWFFGVAPAAASVVVVLSGLLRATPPRGIPISATAARSGVLAVATAVTVPAIAVIVIAMSTLLRDFSLLAGRPGVDLNLRRIGVVDFSSQSAAIVGVGAFAIGLGGLALLARASAPRFARAIAVVALWLAATAGWGVIAWPVLTPLAAALIGIGAAACAAALAIMPMSRLARAGLALRAPLIVFAQLALLMAGLITWIDSAITVAVGALLVLCIAPIARTMPAAARPYYLAAGYAYTLVLFATALDRAGVEPIAVLCLTTSLGGVIALAATLWHRIAAGYWYAVLAVTAVPFVIGVVGVAVERSGWTALSTGVIFVLAAALVVTRRPGLTRLVRSGAAALLLPALAVVVVCLAAQFLDMSGSPVALPVIAGLVAVTFAVVGPARAWLVRRGLAREEAESVSLWVEISAYVTAVITIVLALAREAAGADTAVVVFVILGLGAVALRVLGGRRHGWWLAAASWTGALWSLLASLGVDVLEPYTLPPALGAAAVGAVLLVRRGRGGALFAAGVGSAVVPTLVVLALFGSGPTNVIAVSAWRAWALLAAAVVLLVIGGLVARAASAAEPRRIMRQVLLLGAIVAAAGGPVQAWRYGWNADVMPGDWAVADSRVILPALALSLAGAVLAAVAGALLLRGAVSSRWVYAPAVAFLALGPIAAVRHDWLAIWLMWALMLLLLVFSLGTVLAARDGRTVLPPFWFSYALAWVVGVAGWSQRELRVEVFSLPLGLAVLAAGVLAMPGTSWWRAGGSGAAGSGAAASQPRSDASAPTLNDWPIGFTGSWWVLGPGIVLTLLPSVLATGTDPQLYRPIMVIAIALAAILVGSAMKLAAPFLIGLAVLPIENIVVFAAQLDRAVGAMPWWITLATAGTVLLAIAVTSERRTAQGRGVAARLRELR